ncbi:3-keto-disaccharide hydrolase [Rhodopirellula islandica]
MRLVSEFFGSLSFLQRNALPSRWMTLAIAGCCVLGDPSASVLHADEPNETGSNVSVQVFDTDAPGWRQLDGDDFVRVNGDDQTLVWEGTEALGSGQPIGVTRTKFEVKNFELVIQWKHLKPAGNSGVFAWVPMSALEGLPPNRLPNTGIEVQMLDLDYGRKYTESTGKPPTWFTSHGDIFAVGKSSMQPFPPLSPDGHRSFPSAETTHPHGEWNQYYVRGINGEIRLWVNGVEVSGGRSCSPDEGYLCLESEGSPIRFREIWLRELP